MDYLKYVNIKQGTKSSQRFSNGNTLPLVQRPFGFASFAPQTDSSRGSWFYHPDDKSFEGVRLTHQPSPWVKDRGAIVIHPQSGKPCAPANKRWSGFDDKKTVLAPHYMRYYLTRPGASLELTPTVYGACLRFEFDNDGDNFISVLPVGGKCGYEFDSAANRLYCYTDFNEYNEYECGKFKAYFVLQFEENVIDFEKSVTEDNGIHLFVNRKKLTVSMATSYISYEQAVTNLEVCDFDSLASQNAKIWNEYLGRIEISGDEELKKTFYSCMYRAFLFPHKAYEPDENGEPIHYVPFDGTVKSGYRYTDNGFWDTYRTVYPLFSLIARDEYKEIVEGFINDFNDCGWLPRWSALCEKNCMPSTMIDAVIADAAVNKIISGDLLETAFCGMEKHANIPSEIPAYGRQGCGYYTRLGYVPCESNKESVNLTLDAAYCDWCLSVVADILGYTQKAEMYRARSQNYKNLFDKTCGYMVGRYENGKFREDFDPYFWGRDYTEACAVQTSFAVQHDLAGLAELHGGREELIRKLDELFETPPMFRVGGYGCEIHEMTEMASLSFGQCAINNQPSFHIPFIYAYFGQPEKTSFWVKKICSEAFSSANDGFPGDEDNGSMAGWFIFAALGIYPLCPGSGEFVLFDGFADDIKIVSKNEKFTEG